MSKVYFCIHKTDKTVLSAGPLPHVWGNISGLSAVDDATAADLTWAGYPDHGFMVAEQALASGVAQHDIDEALKLIAIMKRSVIVEDRNQRLAESDWTQMPDAKVDKAAWAEYRQALRDIPQQTGYPMDIVWPSRPA
jgi:membrane-bound lytic murein transglycosylase B